MIAALLLAAALVLPAPILVPSRAGSSDTPRVIAARDLFNGRVKTSSTVGLSHPLRGGPGAETAGSTHPWHGPERATFYGGSDGYFGKPMACGGTLTSHTRGVAMRHARCGRLVTVCHHRRCVTVPVV